MILLCLHRLRPDAVIDTYKKINALKALRLKDFDLDFNRLLDNVNEKKDEITDIDPNAYPDTAYAADMFILMSEGAPEAMKQWVASEHMRWATGETPFDNFVLQQRATKVFTNLSSSGRWKQEFDQKDQIIALTTEVSKLKNRLDKPSAPAAPTAAFTADTGKPNPFPRKGGNGGNKVEPWRLAHKGAEITHEGRQFYWCTEPHYDDRVMKPMYCSHLPGDHNFWKNYNLEMNPAKKQQLMDARTERTQAAKRAKGDAGGGQTADKKKIVLDPTLTNKLTEAFCAQSGMSESQVNAIFKSFDPK